MNSKNQSKYRLATLVCSLASINMEHRSDDEVNYPWNCLLWTLHEVTHLTTEINKLMIRKELLIKKNEYCLISFILYRIPQT